jgi:hypothetical protein
MKINCMNKELENKTLNFKQISLSDRWSPLIRGSNENICPPEKRIQRTLICALCLFIVGLTLWFLQVL